MAKQKRKDDKQSVTPTRPVHSGRAFLCLSVLALGVFCSALGVVYSSFETRVMINEYKQLQTQRNELHVEWGRLLLEQSTWGALSRVQRVATEKLDMSVPISDQVVMVYSDD